MRLTTKAIENAKADSKPYKLADGGGLCLLISPTGAKLWRWRYRFDGKEKMMAFGEYPFVTLKEALERKDGGCQAPARRCVGNGSQRH
jgi:Arm DNA-binding domain